MQIYFLFGCFLSESRIYRILGFARLMAVCFAIDFASTICYALCKLRAIEIYPLFTGCISIADKIYEVFMLTEISVSAAIALLALVVYLLRLAVKQKRNLNRFQGILDVEIEQAKVKAALEKEQESVREKTTELRTEVERIQKQKTETEHRLVSLKEQLTPLNDEAEIQSYGLYQPKYDLGFSTTLLRS